MWARVLIAAAAVPAAWTLAGGSFAAAAGKPDAFAWTEVSPRAGGPKGAVQLQSGEVLAARTQWRSNAPAIVCTRSADCGTNWAELSVIATGAPGDDIGDGQLMQLPAGPLLFAYRHNWRPGQRDGRRRYAIKTAISEDAGKTWQPHSTVAESSHDAATEPEALRGLWSSFLLLRRDGTLQCYFDDEDTPHREGWFRNQWVTMKTWDPKSECWDRPVTVSRARDGSHLSRDGMASVVELPSGRLLCALESVQTAAPHANCIRLVTSDDGGQTWSWRREERQILFQSSRTNYLSISPWLTRLPDGKLLCVFATDENHAVPGKPGTHASQLNLDLKYVMSMDDGRTWQRDARVIYAGTHRTYIPGLLPLRDGSLLVTCEDFSTSGYRAFRGKPAL
ncbi:MAG: sialidase family protein [Verrucomicrobia bacterium]|nr:sialidase family protein [Verrucomicrobiota bacterium]